MDTAMDFVILSWRKESKGFGQHSHCCCYICALAYWCVVYMR